MIDDIFKDLESSYEANLQGLKQELSKLRTGRANLGMLADVRVEHYGQRAPLNQVATLKVADARLITVQPWERNMITPIERAIGASDLGFNPSNDGVLIRVPVPALTGERRQELVKLARRAGEDHKISLRNARRESNDMIKDLQKEGDITEDELHRALAQVDKLIADYSKKVDDLVLQKEQDILEI